MDQTDKSSRGLSQEKIREFLTRLGEQYQQTATLYLLGGSALCLIGSVRPTIDIDYVGSDLPMQQDALQIAMQRLADQMQVEVEAVPLQEFIPLPHNAASRHVQVGQFGTLTVCVFDPYSIALSKVERGLESDLEDVTFLIHGNFISIAQLEKFIEETLPRSSEFNLDPRQVREHFAALRQLLA